MRQVPLSVFASSIGAIAGAALIVSQSGMQVDLTIVGFTVVLVSAMYGMTCKICQMLDKVNRAPDIAFNEGYEMGKDAGYKEGRQVGRPVSIIEDRRKANHA